MERSHDAGDGTWWRSVLPGTAGRTDGSLKVIVPSWSLMVDAERFSISNMGSTQSSANLSLCLHLLILMCPVPCTVGQGCHGLNIELFISE